LLFSVEGSGVCVCLLVMKTDGGLFWWGHWSWSWSQRDFVWGGGQGSGSTTHS